MTHNLGARVVSIFSFDDEGVEVCRPGDAGRVVWLEPDGVPLVRFDRTGCSTLVDGDTEIIPTGHGPKSRARA